MIRRIGSRYVLVSKSKPQRRLGVHRSKAAALRQERAIQAAKARRLPRKGR